MDKERKKLPIPHWVTKLNHHIIGNQLLLNWFCIFDKSFVSKASSHATTLSFLSKMLPASSVIQETCLQETILLRLIGMKSFTLSP